MRAPSWCTRVVPIGEQRGKVVVVITVAAVATGPPHPAFSHLFGFAQGRLSPAAAGDGVLA